MTRRRVDFDAWRKERVDRSGAGDDGVEVVVGGKTYTLPAAPPAMVVMEVMRLQDEHGADFPVPNEQLGRMARDLLGPDYFAEILRTQRLGMDELGGLVSLVLQQYFGEGGEPPNRKARRTRAKKATRSTSSPTGR